MLTQCNIMVEEYKSQSYKVFCVHPNYDEWKINYYEYYNRYCHQIKYNKCIIKKIYA